MTSELRHLVDALPSLIYSALPDGSCDFVNRRWSDYTGLGAEEARGLGWRAAIHPDDLPWVIRRRAEFVASAGQGELEARLRRFDGEYRWHQFIMSPILDAPGHAVRWFGIITDIEERKRAEILLAGEKRVLELVATGEPLARTLAELCRLAETLCPNCTSSSILLLDRQTRKLWCAAAPNLPVSYIQSVDGFAIGPGTGSCGAAVQTGRQVVSPDIGADPVWDRFRDAALANGLKACCATPIFSPQGQVSGVLGMFSDSTGGDLAKCDQEVIARVTHLSSIAIDRERSQTSLMQAHEELKKSEDRLRTIIDTIPTSVFCSLADGADQFWNQRWRDYAGVSSDDARYRGWEAVIHPEDAGKVAEAWDRSIASGRAGEIEVRLRRFDGEYRWFLCRWEPLRDEAGQIVSWYGANADIDDAKRAEQNLAKIRSDLEHVTRITSLSALTASIAHEVNQPLSGIMTNAGACLKMLDADPPNIAGARDTARRTLRDGARAADVISRLRALFSNEGTAVDPVDLNEAAREVVMLSRTELQSKRVILQMELAEDLPLVSGDRIQLQQVILNLLANASEAMSGVEDRPRRLVIRTGQEQNQVSLSVQDVGAGFNVKDADRLFNAFYTTKSGGMGIGLHISRSIIERHQGRLLARSNDGPGATFALYLPRLGPPATGEVRSQAETC